MAMSSLASSQDERYSMLCIRIRNWMFVSMRVLSSIDNDRVKIRWQMHHGVQSSKHCVQ
jgi:hypothetical protein